MTSQPGPMLFFGSGQKIDCFNFRREDLSPHLLGRALAHINRYSGNGDRPLSVAQHSMTLSYCVGDNLDDQRAALMHDVPEVFTGDVPTPIKRLCPDLQAIDDRIIGRIQEVYGIPHEAFERIHNLDRRISKDEAHFMFDELCDDAQRQLEGGGGPLGIPIVSLTPLMAGQGWTKRFRQLFP